jgi:hypothetical protein
VVPVAVWGAYQNWWAERYGPLLEVARQLRNDGYYAAAIVTAQTACEVCTEVVLTEALHARVGDEAVADYITGSLRDNHNLLNGRVQKLYEVLFGHRIQEYQPLWQSFKDHVKRRNDIVHQGDEATVQGADDSIAAVDKVIQHLLQNRL